MDYRIDGITVTGRIDNYDMQNGTIRDYKTASVHKVKFNDFNDWYLHGMIYAWLLELVPKLTHYARTRMVLEQALGKNGLKPVFSIKSKVAVPKTEVLEQPRLIKISFRLSSAVLSPCSKTTARPKHKGITGTRKLRFMSMNFRLRQWGFLESANSSKTR
jgi:hypothetical protein